MSRSARPGDVSVVVMSQNRREDLLRTLPRHEAPVVLVDNASTDGTVEAVRAALPEVTVVPLERNVGSYARTLGVERAGTEFVAFADDDSWWAPGALARAEQHFDSAPRLALLAARILVGPEERLDPICELMAASPLPRAAGLPGPAVLGFVACGAVVRREPFLEVGGFSPVIGFLGEEEVLSQDLVAAGWALAYVDDVVAHHHPATGGPRSGRRRLQTRNALLSVWLRRPLPVVARRTAALAARAGRADERGALLDAVRRLPLAVRDRRRLPDDVERQVRLLEAQSTSR